MAPNFVSRYFGDALVIPESQAAKRRRQRLSTESASRYHANVAKTAESLLEEALTLPAQDRAMVASSLLASLDADHGADVDEAEIDRLWSVETERRAQQLDAGDAELVTWEHLVQQVDKQRSFPASS